MARPCVVLGGSLVVLIVGCSRGPEFRPLAGPANAAGPQSADPGLAIDPDNGDALLTWVAGDTAGWHIYFARSSDRGHTWTAPVRVNDRDRDVTPHGEASPRLIAARGGAVAVAWPYSYKVAGRKWGATHMRFARSTDGGQTWLPTVSLNDDSSGTPGSHTFHGAAWEGDRDLVVAWLDERAPTGPSAAAHAGHTGADAHAATDEEGDATVYIARSSDLGATWSANEPKWGAACPCCRVALARAPDGHVVAAWRKHFPGSVRDIVSGPLDGNDSTQARVHADEWVFPGCPHTGPSIAVDGRGGKHIAWYTGKPGATGIRYAGAGAAAFILSGTIPTTHVAVAGLPGGGAAIAFDRDATAARLLVATVDAAGKVTGPVTLAGSVDVDHPAIAALDDKAALVAWTRQSLTGSQLMLALVELAPR